jgi:hypothetical protein
MSAHAHSPQPLSVEQVKSELNASREISAHLSRAISLHTSIPQVAQIALRIRGVRLLQLEPEAFLASYLDGALSWGTKRSAVVYGCAISDITAGGQHWGKLRLYFDLRENDLEDPLGFARFLAQQLASALNLFALADKHSSLSFRKQRLAERLARRKIVERARGILAELHDFSTEDAQLLLNGLSRRSRRSLSQVAQNIIFNHASTHPRTNYHWAVRQPAKFKLSRVL